MKDSIIVIVLFVIVLVGVLIVSSFFYSIGFMGSRLFLFPSINFENILTLIPNAFLVMILPSVLISLFLTSIRMQKNPGIRIISYLSIGALAVGVLIFAPALIKKNINPQLTEMLRGEELKTGLRDLTYPQQLVAVNEGYFFFGTRTGISLSPLIVIKDSGAYPRITAFDRIQFHSTETGTIFLDKAGTKRISLSPRKTEANLFQPEQSFQSLYDLYTPLQKHFDTLLWAENQERLLLCVMLVALVLSSSVFLRFSRWRIANIMLTLLVLFLVLTLYNFISFTLLPQAKYITSDLSLISLIPYSILIFFSSLFFLFDFILFPRRRSENPNA
ncbi:MAG: hypothetical protein JW904_13495 [Spirochaetales bacterium]|nr:hypothetical protein [Spirochaetales bacterium]